MEKSKYRATYEGSVGREWVAVFNGLADQVRPH